MIFKDNDESQELYVYADNKEELYQSVIIPTYRNLLKKIDHNTYDHGKAINSFYRIACAASGLYFLDFGYSFNVQDRYSAAVKMEKSFYDDHENYRGM